MQPISVGRGVRAAAHLVLGAALAACADNDRTTLILAQEDTSRLEPEPAVSRTYEVLSARSSLDVVCRFIGVSSVAGTSAADRAACAAVVDDCRTGVDIALGADGEASPLELASTNLEAWFGCPLTLPELDGCIGGALERGFDEYGSAIDCDMPGLPEVNPIALLASPECLGVALLCPELVASLAGQAFEVQ